MVLGASALAEGGMAQGGRDVKLLPHHRLAFETTLAPDDAVRRLHSEIGCPWYGVRVGPINATVGANENLRDFVGTPRRDGGDIRRNFNTDPGEIRKRNAFQPVTIVRISATAKGSHVRATIRPPVLAIVFALLWTAGLMSLGTRVGGALNDPANLLPTIGTGLLLSIVPWAMIAVSFWDESGSNELLIRALLERD
jgi:hypothetical protein